MVARETHDCPYTFRWVCQCEAVCQNTGQSLLGRDEKIDHPSHYGGADNPYEVIKVIEAWQLGFYLGNAVKYIARAGKKDKATLVEDLKKAKWYLDRCIWWMEKDASSGSLPPQ